MFSNRFIYKVFGCKCPNTIYSPKPRGKTTTRYDKNIANGHIEYDVDEVVYKKNTINTKAIV